MDIDQIRRINLQTLATEIGGVGKLADKLGKEQSQVSQWIVGSKNSGTGKRRGMRASTCREIEVVMSKPRNWLDQLHGYDSDQNAGYIQLDYLEAQSSAGPGKAPIEYAPILKKLHVLEDWALENFGRNATDKIRIITNKGDSMAPTIQDDDVLFVDITQKTYDADGIYIIDWHGRLLTKRLKAMTDGRLAIISDNKQLYETEYVTIKDIDSLTICGLVKKWWSMRDY